MLQEKMQKALSEQTNKELYSSYLYLSMSSYCERKGLKGFAHWMRIQAQEELAHAMKYYHYILERGGEPELATIAAPEKTWESPLKIFEAVLGHEQYVTGLINDLVDLAIELKDHSTNNFLQWFLAEQVEEEATAGEIKDKLAIAGSEGNALLLIDSELGQRVFVNPLTNQ